MLIHNQNSDYAHIHSSYLPGNLLILWNKSTDRKNSFICAANRLWEIERIIFLEYYSVISFKGLVSKLFKTPIKQEQKQEYCRIYTP